jgi:hypothetical protein
VIEALGEDHRPLILSFSPSGTSPLVTDLLHGFQGTDSDPFLNEAQAAEPPRNPATGSRGSAQIPEGPRQVEPFWELT